MCFIVGILDVELHSVAEGLACLDCWGWDVFALARLLDKWIADLIPCNVINILIYFGFDFLDFNVVGKLYFLLNSRGNTAGRWRRAALWRWRYSWNVIELILKLLKVSVLSWRNPRLLRPSGGWGQNWRSLEAHLSAGIDSSVVGAGWWDCCIPVGSSHRLLGFGVGYLHMPDLDDFVMPEICIVFHHWCW